MDVSVKRGLEPETLNVYGFVHVPEKNQVWSVRWRSVYCVDSHGVLVCRVHRPQLSSMSDCSGTPVKTCVKGTGPSLMLFIVCVCVLVCVGCGLSASLFDSRCVSARHEWTATLQRQSVKANEKVSKSDKVCDSVEMFQSLGNQCVCAGGYSQNWTVNWRW